MLTIARSGLFSLLVCLTIFSIPTSGSSNGSSRPSAQRSGEVTMEHVGTTTFIEPASNAPDETPSHSKWTSPRFFSDLSAFHFTYFSFGTVNLEVVAGITRDTENPALA